MVGLTMDDRFNQRLDVIMGESDSLELFDSTGKGHTITADEHTWEAFDILRTQSAGLLTEENLMDEAIKHYKAQSKKASLNDYFSDVIAVIGNDFSDEEWKTMWHDWRNLIDRQIKEAMKELEQRKADRVREYLEDQHQTESGSAAS